MGRSSEGETIWHEDAMTRAGGKWTPAAGFGDMRCLSLFQSRWLARGQQANRLLQTPGFRFVAPGRLDPGDIPPTLRRWERFEGPLRRRTPGQRCLNVGWESGRQFESCWLSTIGTVGRRPLEPGSLQPPARFQGRVAFPIGGGPSAVGSPRRELARVASVIQSLDQAVHPTEAERLIERIAVVEGSDSVNRVRRGYPRVAP